jgi:hypothetical protein
VAASLSLVLVLLGSRPVRAEDTWSTVAPGIEHLHRTTAAPQDYHVVRIDLGRPEIWLRATGPGENGQRTSAFAASVGATVAVNGDLWDADNWNAYEPLGLAVGDGWGWRDDTDVWSFLACDPLKRCSYDPWGHLATWSPRWWNAVGGMQDLLIIDGVPQVYDSAFHNARHPRTASGLTADGLTLILLVADGRSAAALGMTFADLTAAMVEQGAHQAMNHDGGGSSTLVIGGAIQNVPSDGAERTVANHLAVMIADHVDDACVGQESSRTCTDGTQMRTCIGGLDRGLGDCAIYGLTCEQEGLFAYCVDPRCTNGGQLNVCVDETRIGFCTDGVYSEGDCAGFGLPCVEGLGTAWCYADLLQGEPAASSFGAPEGGDATAVVGEPREVWFDLVNTGTVAWQPGVTFLAPVPRDAASPVGAPSWPSPTRAATVASEVLPGATGRFTLSLVAPAAGDHAVAFGLVQEGVTWFADPPAGGGPADGVLHVTLHAADPEPGADAGTPGPDAAAVVPDGGSGSPGMGGGCDCHQGPSGADLPGILLVIAGLFRARRRSSFMLEHPVRSEAVPGEAERERARSERRRRT